MVSVSRSFRDSFSAVSTTLFASEILLVCSCIFNIFPFRSTGLRVYHSRFSLFIFQSLQGWTIFATQGPSFAKVHDWKKIFHEVELFSRCLWQHFKNFRKTRSTREADENRKRERHVRMPRRLKTACGYSFCGQ